MPFSKRTAPINGKFEVEKEVLFCQLLRRYRYQTVKVSGTFLEGWPVEPFVPVGLGAWMTTHTFLEFLSLSYAVSRLYLLAHPRPPPPPPLSRTCKRRWPCWRRTNCFGQTPRAGVAGELERRALGSSAPPLGEDSLLGNRRRRLLLFRAGFMAVCSPLW